MKLIQQLLEAINASDEALTSGPYGCTRIYQRVLDANSQALQALIELEKAWDEANDERVDEKRIARVEFEEVPFGINVTGFNRTGKKVDLFCYYPDEMSFTEDELVGLFPYEAIDLHYRKSDEYLRS